MFYTSEQIRPLISHLKVATKQLELITGHVGVISYNRNTPFEFALAIYFVILQIHPKRKNIGGVLF